MSEQIGLGEAIRALRAELEEARQQGTGSWLRFQPGPVELELEVSLDRDVNGKVGWKVIEAGAAVGSQRRQLVRLTLTPQLWDATEQRYRTDFLVSGEVTGEVAAPDQPAPTSAPVAQQAAPRTDADPE